MPLIAFDRTHARTSYYALLRYWVPVYQCILFHQLRLSSLDWLSVPSFYRSSSITLNLRIEQIGTVLASWFAMSSSLHQLFGILCITMMFVLRMSVSASPICPGSSITIRNPATGHVQCQKCLVCPAGQDLSVDCGDVITPQTAIVCKPCEQGMTYSSKSEAGACKTCTNCGEYRETIKSCTLTSNAVCGENCTLGAYSEGIRGMCRPCSACCNDGNDYIEPKCKVPWVPKNKQCSDLRLKKCSEHNNGRGESLNVININPHRITSVPPGHKRRCTRFSLHERRLSTKWSDNWYCNWRSIGGFDTGSAVYLYCKNETTTFKQWGGGNRTTEWTPSTGEVSEVISKVNRFTVPELIE